MSDVVTIDDRTISDESRRAVSAVDLGGLPTLDGGRTRTGLLYVEETDGVPGVGSSLLVAALRLALVLDVRVGDLDLGNGRDAGGVRVVGLRFEPLGQPAAVRAVELLADGAVPALLRSDVAVRADVVAGALLAAAGVLPSSLDVLGPRAGLVRESLEDVAGRPGGANGWFRIAGATPGCVASWRAMFVRPRI